MEWLRRCSSTISSEDNESKGTALSLLLSDAASKRNCRIFFLLWREPLRSLYGLVSTDTSSPCCFFLVGRELDTNRYHNVTRCSRTCYISIWMLCPSLLGMLFTLNVGTYQSSFSSFSTLKYKVVFFKYSSEHWCPSWSMKNKTLFGIQTKTKMWTMGREG